LPKRFSISLPPPSSPARWVLPSRHLRADAAYPADAGDLRALILPLTTPMMMADFTAVGGLLLLATGLRICGIKMFAVVNMLPALLLAMPLSAPGRFFA
jgi:hypothetical protein